jgi:hypothetical protein
VLRLMNSGVEASAARKTTETIESLPGPFLDVLVHHLAFDDIAECVVR